MKATREHFRDNSEVMPDGCWRWLGRMDRNGYGRFGVEWAHRASYAVAKGPIPDRHEIDHVCQRTACVNPDHLDAVTKAEHAARTMRRLGKDDRQKAASILRISGLTYAEIADALGYVGRNSAQDAIKAAVAKGLVDPDELPSPKRMLSAADRDDIRDLYLCGVPQAVISRFYVVDSSQVSRICAGLTSGHGAA